MRLIDVDEIRLPKGFFEKIDNVPKFYEWLGTLPPVSQHVESVGEDGSALKHGHWVQGKESARCSECNCTLAGQALWRYCPNCGAKMEVEDETD